MKNSISLKTLTLLSIFILIFSCSKKFSSGSHCAIVTIDGSDYTLDVEVEDNYVTAINFPNGGWLDSDHFNPDDAYIKSNSASFYDDRDRYIKIDFDGCHTPDYDY